MRVILILSCICLFMAFTQAQNDLEPEKKRQIEGTVTDFFGVPWEGAIIKLRSKGISYASKETIIERETKTDNNGKYSFTDLPDDYYEITLLRMGTTLEETKQTGHLFDQKAYRFDFGVEVGWLSECMYFVTGFVKDEKGHNIEGAKVSVLNAFNERRVLSAISDKNGFYQITICNAGQYVVFANTPKYEVQTTTITFQNPKDYLKKANFTLKPLSQQMLNWRK